MQVCMLRCDATISASLFVWCCCCCLLPVPRRTLIKVGRVRFNKYSGLVSTSKEHFPSSINIASTSNSTTNISFRRRNDVEQNFATYLFDVGLDVVKSFSTTNTTSKNAVQRRNQAYSTSNSVVSTSDSTSENLSPNNATKSIRGFGGGRMQSKLTTRKTTTYRQQRHTSKRRKTESTLTMPRAQFEIRLKQYATCKPIIFLFSF